MPFIEPPAPNYETEIAEVVRYFQEALRNIYGSLDRLDLDGWSRADELAALREILRILRELDAQAAEWVEQYIRQSAEDGIALALVALGVALTLDEARARVRINRANQQLIQLLIDETKDDLSQVVQNINRRTRISIRQAAAEVTRAKLVERISEGVPLSAIEAQTVSSSVKQELRRQLGDGANTAIIDRTGRRWRVDTYVDMLVRTKLMEAHIEATRNEAIARGAYYGIISTHFAIDACRYHEGRIVKLVKDAPGNYPTIEQLKATLQIWHPNCRHYVTPITSVEDLPADIRRRAEKQAVRGDAAIATGKRNPKEEELML